MKGGVLKFSVGRQNGIAKIIIVFEKYCSNHNGITITRLLCSPVVYAHGWYVVDFRSIPIRGRMEYIQLILLIIIYGIEHMV